MSAEFRPTASLATLKLRSDVLGELRRYFNNLGYWEVDTPILSRDIFVDAHLDPFVTQWEVNPTDLPDRRQTLFLQTSPEFAMKRLLAAGADAIFQVTHAFRNGEVGRLHNPEFTMIEWYKVGDTHHEQMDFTERLVRELSHVLQSANSRQTDDAVLNSVGQEFGRLSYDAAFARATGSRVLDQPVHKLRDLALANNVSLPDGLDENRDCWLNVLLSELVEPTLGVERPEFLFDYPASQAALAKTRAADGVAERFELYLNGIELCNGYHELTDAAELRRRIRRESELRFADARRALPSDNLLLAAMDAGLPECSGVALGFDRLLMLLIGAKSLREVTAFPFDRA